MLSQSSGNLSIRGIAGSLGLHMQHCWGMLRWRVIVRCLELRAPSVPCFIAHWDSLTLQMSTLTCTHTHTHTYTHRTPTSTYSSPNRKHLTVFPSQVSISAGNSDESGIWIQPEWGPPVFHGELWGPSGRGTSNCLMQSHSAWRMSYNDRWHQ